MDGYEDIEKSSQPPALSGYEDISSPAARAEPKEKSFREEYIQPTTDVLNRAIVGQTIGSLADIGNLPFQAIDYASEKLGYPTNIAPKKPFLGSEYVGEKMQQAGLVSPERYPIAETIVGLAPAILTGGYGLGKYGIAKGGELLDYLKGTKATEGLSTLRGAATEEALAGRSALEAQAAGTTQSEKSAAAAAKDIEEAKYLTKEKLRQKVNEANTTVDSSLKNISDKPITDEQFGAFVSEKGKTNVQAISEATERKAIEEIKNPAFERARTRYEQGDSIATNPNSAPILDKAIADVRQQIADTPADFRAGLEKKLNALFGEEVPLTEAEIRAAKVRSSITGEPLVTTKQVPLTLQQTEFLRRWAKDPILRERTGFGALDDMRMKATGDTLQQAMIAYEKDVGRYIQEYRTGKQAEELALGGKAGESAIEQFGTKPQNIASFYLDGTKASADKLVNLIGGKTPELLSNVRGKIRNDLQGLDAAKTQQYLQNKSGLFETFPELRKSVEELAANRLQFEKLDRMFSGQGKRYSDALNVTQSAEELVGQKAAKTLGEGSAYQDLKIGLEQLEKAQGADIVTVSKTIANTLREKELIDADKYQQMLTYINDVGNNAQKAADLKKLVKRIVFGGSVFAGADYTVRKALGLQ